MVIKFPLTDYKLFHSLYQMRQQAIRNFGSNTGAFWRHYLSAVGNCKSCSRVTGYKLNAAAISPLFTLFPTLPVHVYHQQNLPGYLFLGPRYPEFYQEHFSAKWSSSTPIESCG